MDDANYGRVTLTAVQALLGKVYLYNKNYEKAIENLEKSQQTGTNCTVILQICST